MDRLYQNIMDSSPLSTPYIGKKLVTDKQRMFIKYVESIEERNSVE